MNDQLPGVRVVRGTPDDLELVALVASLASAGPVDDETPEPTTGAWGRDRGIAGARTFGTAPDAWRWGG